MRNIVTSGTGTSFTFPLIFFNARITAPTSNTISYGINSFAADVNYLLASDNYYHL